jgi:hypothetical protein
VLLVELADAVEDGGTLLAVGAVNQMAHDAVIQPMMCVVYSSICLLVYSLCSSSLLTCQPR